MLIKGALMKKRKPICAILCIILLTSVFFMTGCGNEPEEMEIINPITITISIDYPKKSNLDDVNEMPFKIE